MAFRRDKTLAAAERYAARGQHAKACKEYQAVVDNDPADLRVWLLLADSLTRAGRKGDAVDRYLTVARHYAKAEQPQKALAVYRQVLALDPARLDVQLQCAKLFRELGRVSDAVVVFERIAQSTLAAGNAQEAIRLYQTVIELDPSSPSKRVRLAELYSREEMKAEAVEQFRCCADLLREQGRREDFVKVGERLLFHEPGRPETLRQLARAYLELGESRRALIKLNTLLQVEPADVEGLELLGETFLALGKLGKAVSVMVELARVQSEGGPEGRAVARRVLRKALQWDLHDPQLRAMLAAVGEDSSHDPLDASASSQPGAAVDGPRREASPGEQTSGVELALDLDEVEELEVEELDLDEVEELDADEVEELDVDELDEVSDLQSIPEALIEELDRAAAVAEPAPAGDPPTAAVPLSPTVGEVDEDLAKCLAEVRVLIKYHLFDHALSHVETVIADPSARAEGLALRAEVLQKLDRASEAADVLAELAQLVESTEPAAAHAHASAALSIEERHAGAQGVIDRLATHDSLTPSTETTQPSDDGSVSDEIALELFPESGPDASEGDNDDDFAISFESDPSEDLAEQLAVEVEDRFGLESDAGHGSGRSTASTSGPPQSVAPSRPSPDLAATEAAPHPGNDRLGRQLDDERGAERAVGAATVGGGESVGPSRSSPEGRASEADAHPAMAPAVPPSGASAASGSMDAFRSLLTSGRRASPPKHADIDQEVEEIEFFVAQHLIDDARAAYGGLAKRHPGHPRVLALAELLSRAGADGLSPAGRAGPGGSSSPATVERPPMPTNPPAQSSPVGVGQDDEDDEDAYVAAIFDAEGPAAVKSTSTSGAGAAAQPIAEADASTHYDLGTAYRDMGLVQQAIGEFEAAALDSHWRARALVMMAKLQQQNGDTTAAIRSLQLGLDSATTEDERTDANFELGRLYEASGEVALAIAAFERVRVGFRDRDERLESLRG
ncbi:MAG: tetratricopeptide repeat protein [Myxococcales bacterium FL481]|nr:MAG: tetratricopeptide repeat protein [Myxococcales bacterium FL481]